MLKSLSLLTLWIFAPPFVIVAIGGQLIYASRRLRRQRLVDRAAQRIQTHTQLAAGFLS